MNGLYLGARKPAEPAAPSPDEENGLALKENCLRKLQELRVFLPDGVYCDLDRYARRHGYQNLSHAARRAIEDHLIREAKK